MKYDYLVVGAGLFGSIFAYEASLREYKVLVIDKRNHVGGNIYTEKQNDIHVHLYGAHIFHTSNKKVWDYMNQFAPFNHFINSPLAYYQGRMYNLPFNMNTFNQLWGVITPEEAKKKIKEQQHERYVDHPKNLEEQAINLVGPEIYEKLIKGYTEKQWGRDAKSLPSFIIRRIPVRFTYNNNYFDDLYQGIPIGGYTPIIKKMLANVEVMLNTDYFDDREQWDRTAKRILYTGPIDQFYDYQFGVLTYRSLRFEHDLLKVNDFQGNAVVNYTERSIPYTRIIEHKHFEFGQQPETIITKEYPELWSPGKEPYYPINDETNTLINHQYQEKAKREQSYLFGGRLAEYRYYDMHVIVERALDLVNREFKNT